MTISELYVIIPQLGHYDHPFYEALNLINDMIDDDTKDEAIKAYILDKAGAGNFTEKQKELIYFTAWSKGHSSGISEVFNQACILTDFIKEFNNVQ